MSINDQFVRIWSWMKGHALLSILILSFSLRVLYLSINWPLWWDAHVYIGMGKYIFSSGQIGIWEAFRPLIHPTILGGLWKLGLNPIAWGKFLDLVFSLTAIFLLYKINFKLFNKKVAIISSLIFSLTPVFIMHTGLILTEPLALTFGLLGIYFVLNQKKLAWIALSGLFLSLAFLTKFTMGIFFAGIFLAMVIKKQPLLKKIKELIIIGMSFIIPIIPYLVFNYFKYGNVSEPFISGSWIVTTATWLYGNGYTYYLRSFFFTNPLYLLFLVYIYYFFKEKEWTHNNKASFLIISILALLYFTFFVPRKEPRYLLIIIPFMATAITFSALKIYKKLKESKRPVIWPRSFIILTVLLLLVPMPANLSFEKVPDFKPEINRIIVENNITKIIISSDPSFVSFLDHKIITLDGMEFASQIYNQTKSNTEMIFINDCDLLCAPEDLTCEEQRISLLDVIKEENSEVFRKQFKECTYTIYLTGNKVENEKN
jgi:hypothetical protein